MKPRGRRSGAVCLAMLPWPEGAAAGSGKLDQVIEELFVGEAVYPQDALELQVTGDLGGSRTGDRPGASAGLEIEFGITDRLQISAEAAFEWVSTPMERLVGLGNPSLEVMYNPLSNRDRGRALSAGLRLSFPAASRAGEDAWSTEAFAVAYQVLGPVHTNLTASVALELPTGAGAEREVSLAGALGLFLPIGRWVPVLELGAASGDRSPAAVLSAGTLWHPVDDLELGAAVQIGLDARSIGGLVTATVELELAGD